MLLLAGRAREPGEAVAATQGLLTLRFLVVASPQHKVVEDLLTLRFLVVASPRHNVVEDLLTLRFLRHSSCPTSSWMVMYSCNCCKLDPAADENMCF